MANSRSKGQRGELELCRILSEKLGVKVERNLSQTRDGGHDLDGIPGYSIEVKRREKLNLKQWWKQTIKQSGDLEPVLFYRQSRKPWSVMMLNGGEVPTTINLDEFCTRIRDGNQEEND